MDSQRVLEHPQRLVAQILTMRIHAQPRGVTGLLVVRDADDRPDHEQVATDAQVVVLVEEGEDLVRRERTAEADAAIERGDDLVEVGWRRVLVEAEQTHRGVVALLWPVMRQTRVGLIACFERAVDVLERVVPTFEEVSFHLNFLFFALSERCRATFYHIL